MGEHAGSPLQNLTMGEHAGSPLQNLTMGEHIGSPLQNLTMGEHIGSPLQNLTMGEHIGSPLRQNLLNYLPMHIGQSEISTLKWIGKFLMVEAQGVQNRCL
jgi:hypothetical protein